MRIVWTRRCCFYHESKMGMTPQLWSAICFKIMIRYTCGFSHVYLQSFLLHDIRAFFCHVYLPSFLLCGVFISKIWPFSYKRAYICAQKSPYICVTNKHVYMGVQKVVVWETPNYTVSKKLLHVRWSWKVTSVRIKHGRNSRVNFEQGLVLIYCSLSSGGCWLPDNGFVGIRGLSLERLCMYFTNADRNNDRFS